MTGKKQTARAAIYVRVSTLPQIDKDSLPMQRQDLIAYAKLMLNTEDYVVFEDAGVTETMDEVMYDPLNRLAWKNLRDHTLTMGNDMNVG